ncbi:MAG TPA: hypothetical protein VKV40_19880 [Ktedonobacteraceae bacterium]|nr:hypothetical protein [Ktedonobacteraceae bacterium]
MQEIGKIKQVQVQRSSLKAGQKPERYYDPTPLLVVEQLRLSPAGVIGITAEGDEIIDVHNADHPQSKNREDNGVSIGFSSHYESIRAQYGDHLWDGCAGENILIEVERGRIFTLSDLGNQIAILAQATGEFVYLTDLQVAAPCVEFSRFAANFGMPLPPEEQKATLQFLHEGRRGFYATFIGGEDHGPALVQAGDRVFTGE